VAARICGCADLTRRLIAEKYDDLRTWLAADDRNAMDDFARDLLKEIGLTSRRYVCWHHDA
jgi:cell pole-organizing protein PopZ